MNENNNENNQATMNNIEQSVEQVVTPTESVVQTETQVTPQNTVQPTMNNNVNNKKGNGLIIALVIIIILLIGIIGLLLYLKNDENSNSTTSNTDVNGTTTKSNSNETTTTEVARTESELPTNWVLTNDENNNGIADTGDLITLGTENFYVISNDENGIAALAQYNLYVGGKVCLVENEEEMLIEAELVSYYSSDEATGLQSELMQNGASPDYVTGDCWEGITVFSEESFDKDTDSTTYYNNSTIKKYLDNYKSELIKLGADTIEVRLIREEELTELGCTKSSTDVGNCKLAPSWLYGNTNYWTMSYETSSKIENNIIIVTEDGYWNIQPYEIYYPSSVRPVIVIS